MSQNALELKASLSEAPIPRSLDVAVRVSLAGVVGASVLLDGTAETQPFFYAVMFASLITYLLARGEQLLGSLLDYLTSREMVWRWVFVVWAVASLLWTTRGVLSADRAMTLVEIHIVGLVLFDAARRLDRAKYIVELVFLSVVLGALHAMITSDPATQRIHGLFMGPNYFAIAAVLGMLGFVVGVWQHLPRLVRVLSYLGTFALMMGIVATASLKGIVGALFVIVASTFSSRSRRTALVIAAIAIVGASLVFAVPSQLGDYWQHSVYRARITAATLTSSDGVNDSTVQRTRFIGEGLTLIAESPIVGRGLDTFRWLSGEGTYSHNNFIELGVSLGIVGVILYYGMHAALVARALRYGAKWSLPVRYTLILVLVIVLMDFAAVSYNAKLPTFLMITCVGWLGRPLESERPCESPS